VTLAGTVVDTHALVRVILYAFVAGVGVTGVFSFAIVGLTRFDEIRRGKRTGRAFPWAALATVAAIIVVGVVVEGIVVMARK
jgi:hypothetical protein